MFRKRFIALVMALTMLFTLMAPAFTFALDDGEPPDQTPASDAAGDTNEQPPAADPNEGGDDGEGETQPPPPIPMTATAKRRPLAARLPMAGICLAA